MKEEEIKKIIEIDRMLLRENTNLKIICKHLEDRVDKARDYINNVLIPFGNDWYWDHYELEDYVLKLLEILGDKEDE